MAAAMAAAEEEQEGHSGPTDRVGEVGRLLRRFLKQGAPAAFNLNHSLSGIDQVRVAC